MTWAYGLGIYWLFAAAWTWWVFESTWEERSKDLIENNELCNAAGAVPPLVKWCSLMVSLLLTPLILPVALPLGLAMDAVAFVKRMVRPKPASLIWLWAGEDGWVFGEPVRGVVRGVMARVRYDEHQWEWTSAYKDADEQLSVDLGFADSLAIATSRAEKALADRGMVGSLGGGVWHAL